MGEIGCKAQRKLPLASAVIEDNGYDQSELLDFAALSKLLLPDPHYILEQLEYGPFVWIGLVLDEDVDE